MLQTEELIEAIKNVPIKKELPEKFDAWVADRWICWDLLREEENVLLKFLQIIGPGKIHIDSWLNKTDIRTTVAKVGLVLLKNKKTGEWSLFSKGAPNHESFVFKTELLDVSEDEKAKQSE